MACEQTEKWEERWKPFYKANKDIKKALSHRKLPKGEELFRLKMADGTCEVRLYNKNGKYKVLVKGVKAAEAMEVYNSHKATVDGLPLVGLAAKKDKPVKKGKAKAATPKKAAAKKPAGKKKASAKKTAAKKKAKATKDVDPFFA